MVKDGRHWAATWKAPALGRPYTVLSIWLGPVATANLTAALFQAEYISQ